jgi:hypothetical protein
MAIDDEKGIGLNNIIWFLSVSIEGFQKEIFHILNQNRNPSHLNPNVITFTLRLALIEPIRKGTYDEQ